MCRALLLGNSADDAHAGLAGDLDRLLHREYSMFSSAFMNKILSTLRLAYRPTSWPGRSSSLM